MPQERKCGCKGIRSCLVCEKENGISVELPQSGQAQCVYTYCPHCNLCWSDDAGIVSPLYLGRLKLFLEFFSEEEETDAISAIDRIPWMTSQSGRRKQDFGPKVNFKKRKVKVGEFKGFPKFAEKILHRFQDFPELSDFHPVELCHLEYSPERGSSIDPHVDDFWLWGERLVTINLGSSTVLTLLPVTDASCRCHQESPIFVGSRHDRNFLCNHKFHSVHLLESPSKSLSTNDSAVCREGNIYSEEMDGKNSKLPSVERGIEIPASSSQNFVGNRNFFEITDGDDTCKLSPNSLEDLDARQPILQDRQGADVVPSEWIHPTRSTETTCSAFRSGEFQTAIRIVLPPRSLLVLAGCSRYNWSHEIRREDVVSRRLAMTFRELTPEFLDGGKGSHLGNELLWIASHFCDPSGLHFIP